MSIYFICCVECLTKCSAENLGEGRDFYSCTFPIHFHGHVVCHDPRKVWKRCESNFGNVCGILADCSDDIVELRVSAKIRPILRSYRCRLSRDKSEKFSGLSDCGKMCGEKKTCFVIGDRYQCLELPQKHQDFCPQKLCPSGSKCYRNDKLLTCIVQE